MSADNAIAILRTRTNRVGHYEYRLAEYGVSSEPFIRAQATSVSEAKGQDTAAMRELLAGGKSWSEVDEQAFAAAQTTMKVVDGFVAISFRCAQDFCDMFARARVYTNLSDAKKASARKQRRIYVEYGDEQVCVDFTWDELLAQAEVVRQRRLSCLVRGPKAPAERIGNIDARPDFKYLGGPGIEDKLEGWGWSADVVKAAMAKVHAMYFDWDVYSEADNLRFAREGNAAEMERYQRAKAKGCCKSHDESFVVDSEDEGEVRVHFGFNFGH